MGEEVMILDVINRIAEYLNLKATIKIVGLKNGEKMHEELFDGPVLPTRFEPISRSVHSFRNGLVKEIKQFLPKNNIEALEQIENLTLTYLKTV
jgi:FlaA1/EpsC-like NDP-sugar epimerase